MPVYLARFGVIGPVKIGCSANVGVRLDQIGTKLWDDMHILRLLDGALADERRLHQRFAPQRIRHEWFHFHPDMLGDLGLPDLAGNLARSLPVFVRRSQWKEQERRARSEQLRDWMVAKGLCERKLAELLGCNATTVTDWLRSGSSPAKVFAEQLRLMSGGSLVLRNEPAT